MIGLKLKVQNSIKSLFDGSNNINRYIKQSDNNIINKILITVFDDVIKKSA